MSITAEISLRAFSENTSLINLAKICTSNQKIFGALVFKKKRTFTFTKRAKNLFIRLVASLSLTVHIAEMSDGCVSKFAPLVCIRD